MLPNALNLTGIAYHIWLKRFENLVEELTNNGIDNASASSSSNLLLSQPQSSSSTFSNSFDQIDSFRKEESESFHNSKGDIAD